PLVILFAVLWLRELGRRDFVRALSLPAWGLCGALFSALLVALPFWAHGRLDVLGAGLRQVQSFGREYVGLVVKGAGGYLNAAGIGMQCLPDQMPRLLGLARLGFLPARFGLPASPMRYL